MATLELSVDLLRNFLASVDYHYDGTPGARNILGLRSAMPSPGSLQLQTVTDQPDLYNDTIVAFGVRGDGSNFCRAYRSSVDPGLFYTHNPLRRAGCAHLINGQYRYKVGRHKGHTALVQAAHVRVWRDQNRNFVRDGRDFVETGEFGIHIHAAGSTRQVGRHSAGCSVIWGGWRGRPWTDFIHLMTTSTRPLFWYSLLDASDLHAFARHGSSIDHSTAELSEKKRQALQQVLTGIAALYAYQEQADLGQEGDVTFLRLLNRLRQTGVLRNLKPADRPSLPPVAGKEAAREAMLGGFRQIYAHLLDSGLDNEFHSRLNQLRRFGPLGAE